MQILNVLKNDSQDLKIFWSEFYNCFQSHKFEQTIREMQIYVQEYWLSSNKTNTRLS